MIEARGLQVALDGRAVLHGVDAAFGAGWTAVVGPNGAGKSTLLRALAGLLPPAAGQVLLEGKPLASWPAPERARRIAWMSQQGPASGDLPVRDVVALGRLPHTGLFAQRSAADERAVDEALHAVGGGAWAARPLGSLSGGERQRVLLARMLAVGAPVWLLDEPAAHLDPPHQVSLWRWLRDRSRARTVVSVLHDLNLALRADRLLILGEGRVVALGAPGDLEVREALQTVFDGAIQVVGVGTDRVAVPRISD